MGAEDKPLDTDAGFLSSDGAEMKSDLSVMVSSGRGLSASSALASSEELRDREGWSGIRSP